MIKTEGIILAGGLSSRAGTNKLILEINKTTIIEHCILSMYDYCSRIIVVGGHRIDDIKKHLENYSKVDLIHNEDYLDGMFSSVKTGLKHLKGDRFFLIPGDYPMINKATYEALLEVDEDIVIPTFNKRKGHPILMKTHLRDEILNDPSINSLRDYIWKKETLTLEVEDQGILFDVDTMDDYYKTAPFWQKSE